MTLDQLNQLVATMGLLNQLADAGELPSDKCSIAVEAISDCLGVARYEVAEHAEAQAT